MTYSGGLSMRAYGLWACGLGTSRYGIHECNCKWSPNATSRCGALQHIAFSAAFRPWSTEL